MAIDAFTSFWLFRPSVKSVMAIMAYCYAIIDIISQIGIRCPSFDMMSNESSSDLPALLARKSISGKYTVAPFFVFITAIVNITITFIAFVSGMARSFLEVTRGEPSGIFGSSRYSLQKAKSRFRVCPLFLEILFAFDAFFFRGTSALVRTEFRVSTGRIAEFLATLQTICFMNRILARTRAIFSMANGKVAARCRKGPSTPLTENFLLSRIDWGMGRVFIKSSYSKSIGTVSRTSCFFSKMFKPIRIGFILFPAYGAGS